MDINRVLFKYVFYLTLRLRREWFIDELQRLNKSQYSEIDDVKARQLEQLNCLLAMATRNIPHYKSFGSSLIVRNVQELAKLPLLEKSEIRNKPEDFIYKNRINQRMKTSGGSTGAPITILKDSVGMQKELAATWRGYSWAGVEIGDRQARFWGVPRNIKEKWRANLIDFVCNRLRITAFGYNDDSFCNAFIKLKKFRPDYFYGYVSIISEFARYIIKSGLEGQISVKSVITTSEVLTDGDRKIIEKAFGARVFDEYGCGEVGTIAHECEHGSMHINSENIIVEILDENGNILDAGTPGEVVVTDLVNFSMPLIRYRLKDFATLSNKLCECGRTLPILEKIHGRQYDSLINKKGDKFHGEFFLYIVEDARKCGIFVSGVQFVQYPSLDIDVRAVLDPDQIEPFSTFVKDRLKNSFDDTVKINVCPVSKIERESSGKLRVVKSL